MKFNIIYADPPWLYKDARNHKSAGMAKSAYECMPTEDICNIPVQLIKADDCMLCLWAPSPKLPDALEVIKAWGFEYTTILFEWVKVNNTGVLLTLDNFYSGLGHYTNSNTEHVLGGRTGKYWREAKNVKQIVLAPRTKHSEKPEEVYSRIEDLFGKWKRIELFARQAHEGWYTLGNEIDGKDINTSIKELSEL